MVYIGFSLPFLIMILITQLKFPLINDENIHFPRTKEISNAFPDKEILFNKKGETRSPQTPLAYWLWAVVGKSTHFRIWVLRLTVVVAGYLSIIIFYHICCCEKVQHPIRLTSYLLFFPYFYRTTFVLYPDIIALLFGLMAYKFYTKNVTNGKITAGSIFATLAVYTRQFYMFIPAGMILNVVSRPIKKKSRLFKKETILKILIIFAPLICILPLFLYWGGFTPPGYHIHAARFSPSQINFLFIQIGIYFAPYLLIKKSSRNSNLIALAVAIILIPLFFIFRLPFFGGSYDLQPSIWGMQIFYGLVPRIFHIIGGHNLFIGYTFLFLFWFVGVWILCRRIIDRKEQKKELLFIIPAIAILLITTKMHDKYLLPMFPFLILLFYKKIERYKFLLYVWLGGMVVLSFSFVFNKFVLLYNP